jgi:hypothetical protein
MSCKRSIAGIATAASVGEGMAILVVALAFLGVAALGLVTALTVVKGLQRRELMRRTRI